MHVEREREQARAETNERASELNVPELSIELQEPTGKGKERKDAEQRLQEVAVHSCIYLGIKTHGGSILGSFFEGSSILGAPLGVLDWTRNLPE